MTSRPRVKQLRRFGIRLPGLTCKTAERRPYPPGIHGPKTDPGRASPYRRRLEEKQKLRINYCLTEHQLRRSFSAARRGAGHTGRNLLVLLERRLDSVVFRLGFAPTILAARQLISHGHIVVNGARVDRPGFLVAVGDAVALSARARKRPAFTGHAEAAPPLPLPSHLAADPSDRHAGRVIGAPEPTDAAIPVNLALVVEFYAR